MTIATCVLKTFRFRLLNWCSWVKVLKLATRFERLLKERMQDESSKDQDESAVLESLVARYNDFRANAAIKKWQISSDQHQAIWCIIIGLDETSRSLLRSHLDHNKWEESGWFGKQFSQ